MALFKLMRGSASRLPSDKTDGYIWVTYDENNVLHMYIDYEDDNKVIQRGILSAEFANKLRYTADGTIVEIKPEDIIGYNITTNIPYTVRQGANNDATIKCYLIKSYTQTTVTLESIEGIEVGMRWNIFYQKEDGIYKIRGPILAIDTSTNTITISDGEIGVNGEPGITEDFEISQSPTIRGTFIVNGGLIGPHIINDDSVNSYGAILGGSNNFATFRGYVEGINSTVTGFDSHAEGKGTIARGEYAHVEGYKSQANGHASHAENFETITNGAYSHAEGAETQANGHFSHAEGRLTKTSGQSSHAEGESTEASAFAAHAEGNKTVASNSYTHAEGYDNKATGLSSHAEGEGNTVSSRAAHVEGRTNTVSGYSAHAEGQSTVASGTRAHTEGYSTKATADDSHAEGNFSEANGMRSHAEGQNTRANGVASHAQGRNTYADGEYQHAAGKNNIRDTENKYAEIIGIGTSSSTPANGRTLDWQGNAWYAGEVRVGKNNTKLVDETDLNEVKKELGAIDYFAEEASAYRPKQDLEFKSITIQLNDGKPEIVMEFNAAAYFNNTVTNAFIRNDKVGNAFQLIQNEVIYEDGFTYERKDFATRIRIAFRASGGAASTYTDLAELYDSGLKFFNIIEYNGGFTATEGYMSAEQIVDIYGNLMPRNYTVTSGDYPVRYTEFFEDITDRTQLVGVTSHTINYDVKEIGLVDENSLNEAISNSVADWNQNDENASNYVKNRTHYEATGLQEQEIVDTRDVTWDFTKVDHDANGTYQDPFTGLPLGDPNCSNWKIMGKDANVIDTTSTDGITRKGLRTLDGTWSIEYLGETGGYVFGLRTTEDRPNPDSVTITYDKKVEVPVVHQLDEKYIPDTIARTSIIKDLSNALKGNKSGAEVTCDVSPIEHTLKVNARRKNLFDISKVINEADIQVGTGAKITVTNSVLSDFIAIPPNTAFVGNFIRHCAFYDINKNYISDIGSKSATTKRVLTTPSNAYYMRFSYQTGVTDGSNIQIELGTTETPYTPYIADLSTAKVIRSGKNLFNIPNISKSNPSNSIKIPCHITTPITISGVRDNVVIQDASGEIANVWRIIVKYKNDNMNQLLDAGFPSKTFDATESNPIVEIIYRSTYIVSGQYKNIQVEYGTTATEYEPFVEPTTYPINADGTVDGIEPLYPITVLVVDTTGVVIDVEYNRDINSAFAELTQAIISLGGNI